MIRTSPAVTDIIPAIDVEDSILEALEAMPLGIVVVGMCSDAKHELRATGNGPTNPLGQDGTYVQRRKLYAQAHRLVYPIKMADVVGCLADRDLSPGLLKRNKALLRQAAVIELWTHRNCAGAGDTFMDLHGRPMTTDDENEVLPGQLQQAFDATVAYAYELSSEQNTPGPVTIGFIDHMMPGRESFDALQMHRPW